VYIFCFINLYLREREKKENRMTMSKPRPTQLDLHPKFQVDFRNWQGQQFLFWVGVEFWVGGLGKKILRKCQFARARTYVVEVPGGYR
jgi:hypothetical protein